MTERQITDLITRAKALDLAGEHRQADFISRLILAQAQQPAQVGTSGVTDPDEDSSYNDWLQFCRAWAVRNNNTLGLNEDLHQREAPDNWIGPLLNAVHEEFRGKTDNMGTLHTT